MELKEEEVNSLIAERVPPGDRWALVNGDINTVHNSLTETLEAYFQATGKECHFRLEPLNGKLFSVSNETVEVHPEPIKKYNIYGDF